MEMTFNPVTLSIILSIYATGKPSSMVPDHSESYRDAINKLRSNGLIHAPEGAEFAMTERGNVFVEMLKSTPLPAAKYVDPRFYE